MKNGNKKKMHRGRMGRLVGGWGEEKKALIKEEQE